MEYYLAVKKKETLPFVTARTDLESIMLSEISRSEGHVPGTVFAMFTALPCVMCTHILCVLYTGLLYPWCAITIPMYNAHPYFSLKNLGKKVRIITQQNMVISHICEI